MLATAYERASAHLPVAVHTYAQTTVTTLAPADAATTVTTQCSGTAEEAE